MATLSYEVDLKAVKEMYPTVESTKPIMDLVLELLREQYTNLKAVRSKAEETERATNIYRGFNTNPPPVTEYPDYDDAVVASYVTAQGTTYNEVATVDSVLTLEVSDPNAVKLLQCLDVVGTFRIPPSNRVTAY